MPRRTPVLPLSTYFSTIYCPLLEWYTSSGLANSLEFSLLCWGSLHACKIKLSFINLFLTNLICRLVMKNEFRGKGFSLLFTSSTKLKHGENIIIWVENKVGKPKTNLIHASIAFHILTCILNLLFEKTNPHFLFC